MLAKTIFSKNFYTTVRLTINQSMVTLHLIHGFVGAGKTTFARKLESNISAIRFTHDEWMVKLYGYNPPEQKFAEYHARISNLIWELTLKFLHLGQDVILDFGFWSRTDRDEARFRASQANAEIKLYLISCSEKTALNRIAIRNKNLSNDSLEIDKHAFNLFKHRYEALDDDEPHIAIATDIDSGKPD